MDLRNLSAEEMEEVARLGLTLLPSVVVSLVLQCLLVVVGVRTVRQLSRVRHARSRSRLRVAANGPLIGLSVLSLAHWILNTRRLRRWVQRVNSVGSA